MARELIIDGVLYLVFGFLLHRFKSRIAAVCLVILAGFALLSTLLNTISGEHHGGNNLFLAVIVVIVAVRALEASFKYHKYKAG